MEAWELGTGKLTKRREEGGRVTLVFDQFLYAVSDIEHPTSQHEPLKHQTHKKKPIHHRTPGMLSMNQISKTQLERLGVPYPSSSTCPTSPLLNHPSSVILFFVASSLFRYPLNTFGPLIHNSPSFPWGTSFPSSSTNLASMLGRSLPMDPI